MWTFRAVPSSPPGAPGPPQAFPGDLRKYQTPPLPPAKPSAVRLPPPPSPSPALSLPHLLPVTGLTHISTLGSAGLQPSSLYKVSPSSSHLEKGDWELARVLVTGPRQGDL